MRALLGSGFTAQNLEPEGGWAGIQWEGEFAQALDAANYN